MELFNDGEQKILCPYNQAHHIRKSRMEFHLKKCRKSYVGDLAVCDFNTTHRVPEPELSFHYECCPDRKKFEFAVVKEQGQEVYENKYPIKSIPIPVDDSWDTDVVGSSYDPQKYCEEHNVLRKVDTESASVRKNFRITERARLAKIASETKDNVRKVKTSNVVLPPLPNIGIEPVPEIPQNVLEMMKRVSLRRNKRFFPVNN